MCSAVRFVAWLAVVLAIGVQATGLGTLGFNLCVERSGDVCTIEVFGQRCCTGDSNQSPADDHIPTDGCDLCIDKQLALPTAVAVMQNGVADDLQADVPPTRSCEIVPTNRVRIVRAAKLFSNRSLSIPDSLLIAQTIVLRI